MKRKNNNLSLNKKKVSKLIYNLKGGDDTQTTSLACSINPCIDTYNNSDSLNPYCLNAGSGDYCNG
ncbi:hypothetical protein GTQ40_00495 [Flavobacteriaceae bacterium R38]|nr:hypothetical protein [Flavobacteriaceae bacterium R38]